jgi:serine O-acetyltransferase
MLEKSKRINTKKDLKDWLSVEISRYKINGIKYLLQITEGAILKKHQILLRKAEFHYNTGHKLRYLFYYVRLLKIQSKYSLHIPLNCCAKGLHLMHVGPILINGNASIDEFCSIHIGTGIVAGGGTDFAPTIGQHVVLGIGAKIVGGVHVADGIAIGANAVVTKDFLEPDIAIAGVPAKKISDNGSRTWNMKKLQG